MVGLAATGTLSYNGYVFEGASEVKVRAVPIYDDSGRTVEEIEHTITVEAVVANSGGLDNDLETIRALLLREGGNLLFINRGFGDDFAISAIGPKSDIRTGPAPQLLLWEPLGDDKAAQITWEVKVTTGCMNAAGRTIRNSGIKGINWSAEYQIDRHGDTTRTLTGYLSIVQKSANRSLDSADRYRQFFSPAPIAGFSREQVWQTSADRSRVNFSIVDQQEPSPNPYPPGMTAIEGSHRFSFRRGRRQNKGINTISMRISPAAGISGSVAWTTFLNLVGRRIQAARDNGLEPLITDVDVDESLFDRPNSFSLRYELLAPLPELVGKSGLWRPLGTDWTRWAASLGNHTFSDRGHAQLADIPANDVVVNLCTFPTATYPNNLVQVPRTQSSERAVIVNKMPNAEKSYKRFRHAVMPSAERPVVVQSTLQSPGEDNGFWPIDSPPPPDFSMGTASSGRIADTIQQSGDARHSIDYVGVAERAGFPPPRPKVEKVGNLNAFEQSGKFMVELVEVLFSVPIYRAAWNLRYKLVGPPGRIETPKNLAEGQ